MGIGGAGGTGVEPVAVVEALVQPVAAWCWRFCAPSTGRPLSGAGGALALVPILDGVAGGGALVGRWWSAGGPWRGRGGAVALGQALQPLQKESAPEPYRAYQQERYVPDDETAPVHGGELSMPGILAVVGTHPQTSSSETTHSRLSPACRLSLRRNGAYGGTGAGAGGPVALVPILDGTARGGALVGRWRAVAGRSGALAGQSPGEAVATVGLVVLRWWSRWRGLVVEAVAGGSAHW